MPTALKKQPPQDGESAEIPPEVPLPVEDVVDVVEIGYRDLTFTVPKNADDWDTNDLETLYLRPNIFDVVRACIGADEYDRFQAKYPKHRDFKAFRDQLTETINKECVGF